MSIINYNKFMLGSSRIDITIYVNEKLLFVGMKESVHSNYARAILIAYFLYYKNGREIYFYEFIRALLQKSQE